MANPIPGKLKTARVLASVFMATGILLLAYMISVEGEPGALPLFLFLGATVCLVVIQYRIRRFRNT